MRLSMCRNAGTRLACCQKGRLHRPWAAAAARPAAAAPTVEVLSEVQKPRLLYEGVIFDMDGTLTEAHIDFKDMRARTGIPVGDLFVSMESWEEEAAIKAAMDVILEIEAEAAQRVSTKAGCLELLAFLQQHQVKVALVTRNTTASVEAFFNLVGPTWRALFSEVRTREFAFVKPDKRLLLDVAQAWGCDPARLLMVGDSTEDVEVGNATGTATCLIAGGGNEVPGCNVTPPPGAVPTMCVESLGELQDILARTSPGAVPTSDAAPEDALDMLGWPARLGSSSGSSSSSSSDSDSGSVLDPSSPGAPAPGLSFVDDCILLGALRTASCSFPRMGAAAGGLAACPLGGGDSLLHVGCGDASLTKMLASKGLQVVGVDRDVSAGLQRGLKCATYTGQPLEGGSLAEAAMTLGGSADVVLVMTAATGSGLSSSEVLKPQALRELRAALSRGGYLCVEVPSHEAAEGPSRELLQQAGFEPRVAQLQDQRLRLIAVAV